MKQPTDKDRKSWAKWLEGRPVAVRKIAEAMPPWELFQMNDTGQTVSVIGYFENGTVRVYVHDDPRTISMVGFEVFGVDPADLTLLQRPH